MKNTKHITITTKKSKSIEVFKRNFKLELYLKYQKELLKRN